MKTIDDNNTYYIQIERNDGVKFYFAETLSGYIRTSNKSRATKFNKDKAENIIASLTKPQDKAKLITEKTGEIKTMKTIEQLNEIVNNINSNIEEDKQTIDFMIKLQDLLNQDFNNETLQSFRENLDFIEV